MKDKEMKRNTVSVMRLTIKVVMILAFLAIWASVAAGMTDGFDDNVRFFFYDMRSEGLTAVAKVITYLGNWQSIVILCLILLIVKPTRVRYGIPVSAGAIFVTVLNRIIKLIAERPRPDEMYHLIEEGGFSFASGHAITSMFVYGMLIYLVRTNVRNRTIANVLTVVLLIPAFCIGISRIYLGVHYPTDVLAGWCLGIATIVAAVEITEKVESRKKKGAINSSGDK